MTESKRNGEELDELVVQYVEGQYRLAQVLTSLSEHQGEFNNLSERMDGAKSWEEGLMDLQGCVRAGMSVSTLNIRLEGVISESAGMMKDLLDHGLNHKYNYVVDFQVDQYFGMIDIFYMACQARNNLFQPPNPFYLEYCLHLHQFVIPSNHDYHLNNNLN